jgi:F0F1-type ATP synthase assembly protein I
MERSAGTGHGPGRRGEKLFDRQSRPEFRKLAELSSLGLILPSSIAVGLFFGYVLDRWLHTHPWFLIIFLLLGVVSGFQSLYRALKKNLKDEFHDE